jgi:DNA polymerase III subunit delta'
MQQNVSATVYPWQIQVWDNLTRRFPKIGHGLLFYGKAGSGRDAFAQAFLAWVLCAQRERQNYACGECASCQWLKSDTHPNYIHITTDDDNKKQNAKIKIEKIRDLIPFVQQTVDGWRVVLIQPAEALNIASANALLKTLEEPGERVLILVLAEHYLKLPATIRSRLQHFALDRILPVQAQAYLNEQLPNLDTTRYELLMNLANHMPLKAVELAESEWLPLRADFVQDWLKLVSQKHMPMTMASKWGKLLNFSDWLMLFEYLLSDLICVKLQQAIKNTDLNLTELAEQYDLEALFGLYDRVQKVKPMLQQNVQSALILDELFIQMMNIK